VAAIDCKFLNHSNPCVHINNVLKSSHSNKNRSVKSGCYVLFVFCMFLNNVQGLTEVRGIRKVPGVIIDDYDSSMDTVPPIIHNRDLPDSELSWFKSAKPYRFKNLQLLATEDQSIVRRVKSSNLLWLRWYNCPHSCLPSWTPMKNLRVLDVMGNKLDRLWRHDSQVEAKAFFPPLHLMVDLCY
jgi:hypothetical protein